MIGGKGAELTEMAQVGFLVPIGAMVPGRCALMSGTFFSIDPVAEENHETDQTTWKKS